MDSALVENEREVIGIGFGKVAVSSKSKSKLTANRQPRTSPSGQKKPFEMTIRIFDITLSLFGLIILSPLLLVILLLSIIFQRGSPLFRQLRVGRDETRFTLIKFRTMRPETGFVGTHEVHPGQVTAWGKVLRNTKIDELPQLWNVFRGEMSLVGPRPCLPNQTDLIQERQKLEVFSVRPGVTGLAQIQGIDMSKPELLAQTDAEMIRKMSVFKYFNYILLTVCGWGRGDRVRLER